MIKILKDDTVLKLALAAIISFVLSVLYLALMPSTVHGQQVVPYTFKLTWKNSHSESAPVEGTIIERERRALDASPAQPFAAVIKVVGATVVTTNDAISGLPGQQFCYRAKHFNTKGESPYSNTACSMIPVPAAPPALVVNKTLVLPGDEIEVVVSGGPTDPRKWVAMNLVSAPDNATSLGGTGPNGEKLLTWQYLNGSQTLPAANIPTAVLKFTVPHTYEPGEYNFRYYVGSSPSHTLLLKSEHYTLHSITQPSSPSDLEVLSIDSTEISLNWKNPGLQPVRLYRAAMQGKASSKEFNLFAGATKFIDTGLLRHTKYCYTVDSIPVIGDGSSVCTRTLR